MDSLRHLWMRHHHSRERATHLPQALPPCMDCVCSDKRLVFLGEGALRHYKEQQAVCLQRHLGHRTGAWCGRRRGERGLSGSHRENAKRYLATTEDPKAAGRFPQDLIRFLEAMFYTISRNVLWSMSCPRYNSALEFSPQQLEWMGNGIPDYLREESVWRPRTLGLALTRSRWQIPGRKGGISRIRGDFAVSSCPVPATRTDLAVQG
jgi:hypothetical protein